MTSPQLTSLKGEELKALPLNQDQDKNAHSSLIFNKVLEVLVLAVR